MIGSLGHKHVCKLFIKKVPGKNLFFGNSLDVSSLRRWSYIGCVAIVYMFSAMYKRNYWQKKLLSVLLNSYSVWGKYVNPYLKCNVGYFRYDIQEVWKFEHPQFKYFGGLADLQIFWCITIPSKPNLWYQFKPFILSAENFMCLFMDYIMVWYERIPYSNGLTHGINLLNFYPYLSNLTVKLFHVLLIQLFKYEICKKE